MLYAYIHNSNFEPSKNNDTILYPLIRFWIFYRNLDFGFFNGNY